MEQGNHDTVIEMNVEDQLQQNLPLYIAALNGDWDTAKTFMLGHPEAITARIYIQSMTPLHVAARAGHSNFVKELVGVTSPEVLAIPDFLGRTALHYASMSASKDAVEKMVTKKPDLTQITDNKGWTPLLCAAYWGSKEVVQYLICQTKDDPPASPFTGPLAGQLICAITRSRFYDVASDLLERYPSLATYRDDNENSVLRVLSEMPLAFWSGRKPGFLRSFLHKYYVARDEAEVPRDEVEVPGGYLRNRFKTAVNRFSTAATREVVQFIFRLPVNKLKQIRDENLSHDQAKKLAELVCNKVSRMNRTELVEFFKEQAILNTAASHGIEEIVRLCCFEYFPNLIWLTINQQSVLQVAVEHRQKRIFDLLKGIAGSELLVSVDSGTNILHVVAKLPPPFRLDDDVSPIFQMQNELQWFEDVNEIVHPSYKDGRNALKQAAWKVFVKEHKELAQEAEKSAKETANYCMVAAALVTTVVFTAAFTPPGGTYSDKGIPIFLKHWAFILFAICDVLALYLSSTSMLMCLSILGSRTPVKDFLSPVPDTLAIAVSSLVLATLCMIIAFGSALWLILDKRLRIVSTVIAFMSFGPTVRFLDSQSPLILRYLFLFISSYYEASMLWQLVMKLA